MKFIEFHDISLELNELGMQNYVTAIVDCGVAPGMDNVILGYYNESYKCRTTVNNTAKRACTIKLMLRFSYVVHHCLMSSRLFNTAACQMQENVSH